MALERVLVLKSRFHRAQLYHTTIAYPLMSFIPILQCPILHYHEPSKARHGDVAAGVAGVCEPRLINQSELVSMGFHRSAE